MFKNFLISNGKFCEIVKVIVGDVLLGYIFNFV